MPVKIKKRRQSFALGSKRWPAIPDDDGGLTVHKPDETILISADAIDSLINEESPPPPPTD